jgi:hypothetical protein
MIPEKFSRSNTPEAVSKSSFGLKIKAGVRFKPEE